MRHRRRPSVTQSAASGQPRSGGATITILELFFDLVYVFAIGRLSNHLLAHVDLRTGAETAILALAVIHAWYMATWAANWLDPDRLPVRLFLLGLMFASLVMSAAISDAFDGRAWLFVTGYLLFQLGRATFLIIALRGKPLGEHFVNDLVWELLIGAVWIAGALADSDARLALWGLAVAASYGSAAAQHWLPGRGRRVDLEHAEITGGHLIERFRLFFIVALGETVLLMGDAFTDEPFELERLLALALAFTGAAALWWCTFQRVERVGLEAIETAEDAGAVGWRGTWTLTLIVLAVIGIAVGDELAIAHPDDDITVGFSVLALGGPALFLVAQGFFLRGAHGHIPHSRPLGLAALTLLAFATAPFTQMAGLAAATAVLLAVAIADTVHEPSASARASSEH